MDTFLAWLQMSWLAQLSLNYPWFFPTMEILHFLGLCLLIGSLGLIDLRLLGFAKRLSIPALHDLLPWSFVGFGINLASGTCMFAANVDMYYPNIVFRVKMLLIILAGLNALLFKLTVAPKYAVLGPDANASLLAKGIAASSLFLWVSVILAGRLLPYFGEGGG